MFQGGETAVCRCCKEVDYEIFCQAGKADKEGHLSFRLKGNHEPLFHGSVNDKDADVIEPYFL